MEDLEIGNSPRNNNGNHTEERQDTAAAAAAAMMEDNNNKNHNGERHEEPRDDDELDAELGLTASERPVMLLGPPMDDNDVHRRNAYEEDDDADEDYDDDDDDSVESVEMSSPPPPRPGLTRENPFVKRRSSMVVRRKNRVGAETGNAETYEIHCEAVDDERYHHPMNPSERKWMGTSIFRQKTLARARDAQLQEQQTCQYRLTSRKISQGIWNPLKLVTRDEFQTNRGLNALIADYLIWTFQTNMAAVLFVSASFYILFTLVFAIAIYIAGRHQPDCIDVGNFNFNSSGYYFMDAFSLSWQTTTTAGYGIIYPKTGSTISHSCVALTILTALESFGGVLLAGCITALIFSKMVRVQAIAAVEFCDPLVVRYGAGVMPAEDDVLSQVSSTEAELAMSSSNAPASPQQRRLSSSSKGNNMESMMLSRESLDRHLRYPCPVLEFRVINQLHEQAGGEICNASINVVAVTAASRASSAILQSIDLGKRQREHEKTRSTTKKMMRGGALLGGSAYRAGSATSAILKKSGNAILRKSGAAAVLRQSVAMLQPPNDASLTSVPETLSTNESLEPRHESNREPRSTLPLPISVIERSRQHLAFDEDPSVSFVTRRIFSKLNIETDTHPFFKRVWNIRHVLNENSPLLSNEAKRLIEENQGFWPEKLNNYHQVRKHIHFHELIANFSGTSNVSGVTVYAQKVYLFSDLNIGYQFAQVLFQGSGGRLIVDARLLNDVTEQYRGGAEPLMTDEGNSDLKDDVARPRYQQRKQEANPTPSTKSKLTIPAAV